MNIAAIQELINEYNALQLHNIIDYDKFNEYAITHHSTAIEGSTLTENETRLLLEEGLTPKGKPLIHSLIVKDHYQALQYILQSAKSKTILTTDFIKAINALVMKGTGNIYNTALPTVDAGKGDYRKGNVSAGGFYFINYDKVPSYTDALIKRINNTITAASTIQEQLELSFTAHFDLVNIHPFYDGNGRTSRLLMNYLQALFSLPLAIVYKEDKANYFTALQTAIKQESIQPFYEFTYNQYTRFLQKEIDLYKQNLARDKPANTSGFSIFF